MARDGYHIYYQNDLHFITCTIVRWIDIFTRLEYKEIIVNSLNYCIKNKGLEIYGWVIMSNHIHLLCRVNTPHKLSFIIGDFKRFTSKRIVEEIQSINESRRDWLLDQFGFEARRTRRAKYYKVWQDGNHPILIDGKIEPNDKLEYIHLNPVRSGLVDEPHYYRYSSAIDYANGKGLIPLTFLD